jgi:hypothetical protein
MKINCHIKIEISSIFVKLIIITIMAAPLVMAGVGAGLQGISLINSYFDKKQAEQEAARLANTPIQDYSMSPELLEQKRIASNMFSSPQGYTPQETATYDRNIRRVLAGQNYNATNVGGGGVGRVIGAMGNAASVNAATDFAANDAVLARQNRNMGLSNLNQIANKAQSIKDMNTQFRLNRRLMQEQAVGNAIRSNKDLINGAFMGIGQDLVSAGLTKGLMPKDGGGTGSEVRLKYDTSTYGGRRINPNLTSNMPPNYSFEDITSSQPDFKFEAPRYSRRLPISTLDYNERGV